MVDAPAAPALATVAGVELGTVGYWNISNADDWHPTSEDFAAAIAALDCPAVRRPVLKFGHTGTPGEGDPTLGMVDNLRMSDDGQTLLGDFVGVPGWLAEPDAQGRSVLASAYPDRSGEWVHNYVCQLGHTHKFVLRAMALLGVVPPGIGTLESLYDLYTKAPEKEVSMTRSGMAVSATTVDQVRRAYYDGPAADDFSLWIREMFVDPPELIVQNDRDDSLLRVPYTAGDDGVDFAEGQPVKVEYVAARTAASGPVQVFESSSQSRQLPLASQIPSAGEAEAPEEKEPDVATLKESLAVKLGLDATADEATVIAAFDDAIAAGATPPAGNSGDGAAPATETGDETGAAEPVGDGAAATPEQVAAAAKRYGLTVLDTEVAAQLTADAAAGREARDRQQAEDDARVVDTAIAKGKITPARRQHFLTLMTSDREGTTTLLEQTLQESAVPLTEIGHSTEPVNNPADNPIYENWSF